jgi:hypothetical protein
MQYDEKMGINIHTRVRIRDMATNEVLVDKGNRIHPQNMSRIIARALANEPNSFFYRMAFGNGGSYTDAAGNTVFNPPNDGSDAGWESRLYNETYSEIIDESSTLFGSDPGSADNNVIRPGGGADPADDPSGGGVTSVEVGKKSNITVVVVLNQNEPSGQMPTQDLGIDVSTDEIFFRFDEIGLYSPGLQAVSTAGLASVNLGDVISTDNSTLATNTTYSMSIRVDGTFYNCAIRTPSSGTGLSGQLTYGDFCEGFNTGAWILSGDPLNTLVYVYVTDRSGGTYPSITGKQSFGLITFQSFTIGPGSAVVMQCASDDVSNIFNVMTSGICANVNYASVNGVNAGIANNPIDPSKERERLLTHFIFDPILKSKDRALEITYQLTVSITGSTSATYISP